MMCEERDVGVESLLRSLATRVPRIILQRPEEMFQAVRECMVSVLCMYTKKRIVLSSCAKQILYDKRVLVFIIYLMTVNTITVWRVISPS
jgi:hypothetical protein